MRFFKNILLTTLPAVLILLVILELFFRFVIPASYLPGSYFNEDEKILSFSNKREKGKITIGRFAEIRSRFRINNMGWNYPIDYHPVKNRKLIAVIGDSYIEAIQVDVDKNYPYLLREQLRDDYEVYAFGTSGAPLSQYLNISRYVNRHFNPDILIFNLIYNDFDESIKDLDPTKKTFLQLSVNNDSTFTETIPQPSYSSQQYRPLKRVIFKSAIIRYLWLNLHINDTLRRRKNAADYYVANINASNVKKNKKIIFSSTEYLINAIREENSNKRIIFVFDAPRLNIYGNTLHTSDVLWMNEMVEQLCSKYNIEYIDLAPLMQHDYTINQKKFNSDVDFHWNEYGHRFVAKVLYEYIMNNN